MMDSIVQGPCDNGGQDLNLVDASEWSDTNPEMATNNSTLLYIAVEYVKDQSNIPSQEVYSDFDPHVSPLDPNMSSVARYSPVYNEQTHEYNNVVYVTSNSQSEQHANASIENIPTVLSNNDINNQYLELDNAGNIVRNSNTDNLQLVAPHNGSEQEVELLITDEATGISYSVSTQELLVERCMEDQQILNVLNVPDHLLDSDLLELANATTELNENMMQVDDQTVSYMNKLSHNDIVQTLNSEDVKYKMETRGCLKTEIEEEDEQLMSLYSITDQPILSRARATLPDSYLTINAINEELGVFAKKGIPKRTQFGPLEGLLHINDPEQKYNIHFLIELNTGIYRVDVSDENNANWMIFVRKANNYEEQNLLITEENGSIYFTSCKMISPKQELRVGYSHAYAQLHNLKVLKPIPESWPCFECSLTFPSSEKLQNHLNVHDEEIEDENSKPRKKSARKSKQTLKKFETEALECNICGNIFSQYNYAGLKNHLTEVHNLVRPLSVEESFSIVLNYVCDLCETSFRSEALLKIHNLDHDPDSSEEQTNHVCPSCSRKFPTQRQLSTHILQHALPKIILEKEKCKCPVCWKCFLTGERLQRHMLVHGSDEHKPLKCEVCHKGFLNNSALACHIKTHYAGQNLFECPICNEKFDQILQLKQHVPKHCIDNQFTCPTCKKIFKTYSVIRKHIRAFHSERKFACKHCPKRFPTVDKLQMHSLRHSDHREFLCSDCGVQFKRKDKLKAHIKNRHCASNVLLPKENRKNSKKFIPKVEPTDFHRFIYKCHSCLVGFKRRGMLVNHLAKKHPDISPDTVPELNLPILQTTRDYYCQYCDKVYKSSSKRKAHILKNHPGNPLPTSNRRQGSNAVQEVVALPNASFSQTVGSITTRPQNCQWCFKQYASKAKLLQHQRKNHSENFESKLDIDDIDISYTDLPESKTVSVISNEIVGYTKIEPYSDKDREYNDKIVSDQNFDDIPINENVFIDGTDLDNSNLYSLMPTRNGLLPPR